MDRLLPPGAANQLTDPSWLDLQRRMGFLPGAAGHMLPHGTASVSATGAHLPGVYPPVNLASDLLAREREKLDRLGRYSSRVLQLNMKIKSFSPVTAVYLSCFFLTQKFSNKKLILPFRS